MTELFKKESFVGGIAKAIIGVVKDELAVLKDKVKCLEEKVNSLEHEVNHVKSENVDIKAELQEKADQLEQHSRRNNLRIFGIVESLNENTEDVFVKIIQDNLNIVIPNESIEKCHRIGFPHKDKKRPVLVKFMNHKLKEAIFYQKKLLKGTGISIGEDLTKHRVSTVQTLQTQYGRR